MKLFYGCALGAFGLARALALPSQVIQAEGVYQIQQSGAMLQVTAENGTKLHWQSFSIDQGETVHFLLPTAQSVLLNKVTGSDPSQIFGSLLSNGHVYLVNPAGILIGKEARIDTAGFIATTLDMILDNDGYQFVGESLSSISISGEVIARDGNLMVIGGGIDLNGRLACMNGNAYLWGSSHVFVSEETQISASSIAIEGEYVLFPKGAEANADGLGNGGKITLFAEKADVHGSFSARGGSEEGNGGFIEISAHHLNCSARVDASALKGNPGEVIFDPLDIQIIPGAVDTNVTVLAGSIYEPNASPSTISQTTIDGALAGANVTVRSIGGAGADPGDLFMTDNYVTIGSPFTLTLEAFRDIRINASLVRPSGSVILRANNGDVVIGNAPTVPAQSGDAFISTNNGNLTIEAPLGSLLIQGNAVGPFSAYARAISGDVNVNTATGVFLTADNNTNAFAQLGSPTAIGGVVNSNINVITAGDVQLIGGNSLQAYAQIGHGTNALGIIAGTMTGNIRVTTPQNLMILGGTGQRAYAKIGHQGGDPLTSVDLTGDVAVDIGQNVTVMGGNSLQGAVAQIGHGSYDIASETYSGSIFVIGGGQFNLQGGNNSSNCNIGFSSFSSTGPFLINSPLVRVESTTLFPFEMTPGSGPDSNCVIGIASALVAPGSFFNFNIEVDVAGDLNMHPNTGVNSSPSISVAQGPNVIFTGNIIVNVGGDLNIDIVGGGGNGGVGIDVTSPPVLGNLVTINAQNIFVTSSSTSAGFQSNGFMNINAAQDISFTTTAPGGFAAAFAFNDLNIECGNDLSLISAGAAPVGAFITTVGGNIVAEAGNNVFLIDTSGALPPTLSSRVTNLGSGQIDVIAGLNMTIGSGCGVIASAGDVNLVVDNDFPTAPGIGPGALSLLPNSTVAVAAGRFIRLFTARQNQNSIQGILTQGGVSTVGLVLGPLYGNVPPERWGVYYFNPFFYAGQLFTIFYKDFLQEITEIGNTVVSELLFGFNPVDEFAGWPDVFSDLWKFSIFYNHHVVKPNSMRFASDEYYWIQRARSHFIKQPEVHR